MELHIDPQEAFGKDIMMLGDTGVLRKMELDVLSPDLYVPDPKVRYNTPISIYEMGTAFMAEAVGIVLGILCFLAELCKGKRNRKLPSKSTRKDLVISGQISGNMSQPHGVATGNVAPRGDSSMPSPKIFLDD